MKLALQERPDNLNVESLNSEEKTILEKFQHKKHLLTQIGDFTILSEMAAETGKLWNPNEPLKVFFLAAIRQKTKKYYITPRSGVSTAA